MHFPTETSERNAPRHSQSLTRKQPLIDSDLWVEVQLVQYACCQQELVRIESKAEVSSISGRLSIRQSLKPGGDMQLVAMLLGITGFGELLLRDERVNVSFRQRNLVSVLLSQEFPLRAC